VHPRTDVVLTRHTEPLVGRTSGDQDGVAAVPVPRFGLDEVRILVVADFHHVLRREQFDAVALRLLDDTLDKFRTCYSLGKTRIVIEALGNTGLPPRGHRAR
jgi:hypothetical protein